MARWTSEQKQQILALAEATTIREAAEKFGVPEGTIKRWRSEQRTKNEPNQKTEPNRTKSESEPNQKPPEPFPGQCTAIGHKSGQRCRNKAMPGSDYCRRHADAIEGQCTAKSKQSGERCKNKSIPGKNVCKFHGGKGGCPKGAQNALKHGFFARIFPDDEETRALIQEIMEKDPLDILWENIMIQYVAIARGQKIMFVKDKDDLTKHLKREKETSGMHSDGWEKEYELQFAWDKQASFLKAQSAAMKTLEVLIARYEELIQKGQVSEEHKLRLAKLKQDMDLARERMDLEKAKTEKPSDVNVQNYMDALESAAEEVWLNEDVGEDDEAASGSV